jgi:aspartokinase-like uncharacterized kinase
VRAAVVKLGGSTAVHKEVDVWTAALVGSSLPLVIVPGGGPFADQVRDAQKRMEFSDTAAHAMAILAMEQFGHVILDRHERFSPARSTDEMRQALEEGRIPVWLPSAMAVPAPDIPASWDITSDSLAAWLVGKLSVETLLLIKQASNFSNRDDVESLTTRGIVDTNFAAMLPDGIDLFVADPRDAGSAAAMLSSGRLPGVRIASRASSTPDPSPQGGGGLCASAVLRQPSTVLAESAVTGASSPLWGGVRGGGTTQSNGRA